MKSVIRLAIALIAILMWSSCSDEEYTTKSTLYGTIIEATDGTPIEGALVTNMTTGNNCITKEDGKYEFRNLDFSTPYSIHVEKEGYIPSDLNTKPSKVRDNIELNITLSKLP